MVRKSASTSKESKRNPIEEIANGVWDYLEELLDSLEEDGVSCNECLCQSLCSRLQTLHNHIAQSPELKLFGKRLTEEHLAALDQLVEQAESTALSTQDLAAMQSNLHDLLFRTKPR